MSPELQKKLGDILKEYDALEMGVAESFKWPRDKVVRFGELSKIKVLAEEHEKADEARKKSIEDKLKSMLELSSAERNKAILEIRANFSPVVFLSQSDPNTISLNAIVIL